MAQGPLRTLGDLLVPADPQLRIVYAVAALIVFARSAILAFAPQALFDSDQAVFGLMAKHLSEGRAFPVFMYGQNYILAVEAWMAAPLFLIGGPSVALLKLPLVAISLLTAVLLIGLLARDGGLRPWLALAAALFFVLPPPGTAAQLLDASGGNLEPFFYILLLWIVRHRGVALGVILAFGFLHREFTMYGLMALAVVEAIDGSLWTRANLRQKARAAVSFSAVWIAVALIKTRASAAGPGTSIADVTAPSTHLGELIARFCGDLGAVVRSGATVYREYLAYLLGLRVQPVSDFAVESEIAQGLPGLSVLMAVLVTLCVLACVRSYAGASAQAGPPPTPQDDRFIFLYLGVVGVAAIVFYVWGRCGELTIYTLRYGLLALFAMIALTGFALKTQTRATPLRRAIVALVVVWAAASGVAHARIIAEYARQPPPNWRGILADYLVERGVHYAESDYWTAYHVTFLSGERVIVSTNDFSRIATYRRLIDAHRGETWTITRERCASGLQVIPEWWVCPP